MRRARFSVRSSRSMVAALMRWSFWRVSGSKSSSPNFSRSGHLRAQDRHQALAAQTAEQVDLPQRRDDLLVVEARSTAPTAALADHDLDHLAVAALEHRPAPHPQHPPGVVAGAAVQFDELVEHRRLLSFAGAAGTGRPSAW